MRLYTRKGDTGVTGLTGGKQVPKEDDRVAAYGELDELSSFLGLAQAELPEALQPTREILERVQHELFILSAELASPPQGTQPAHRIEDRHVERLEKEIDTFSGALDDLQSFVLPRGTTAGARLHVARAVARRAERAVVRLHRASPQRPPVLAYVNRLSGLLFVLALRANQQADFREIAPDYSR